MDAKSETRECAFAFVNNCWVFDNDLDEKWLDVEPGSFTHPSDLLKTFGGYIVREFPDCYISIVFNKVMKEKLFEYRRIQIRKGIVCSNGRRLLNQFHRNYMQIDDLKWLGIDIDKFNNDNEINTAPYDNPNYDPRYNLTSLISRYRGTIIKHDCIGYRDGREFIYIDAIFERNRA